MRKNNLQDQSDADAAAKLGEDEEIILSDVRTIRKNKRQPPAEPADLNIIDVDDENDEIDADSETEFPIGTIGFRAFGGDGDPHALTECNILVVRKPDGAGDNFLKPCKARLGQPPIRNVDLMTPESEIEEMVRINYGGGHYYLQTQFGNRNGRGWTASLDDPPDALEKARRAEQAERQPIAAAAAPDPPINHFEQRIKELELERQYDELKFGPERKRLEKLETELDDLRRKAAEPPAAPKSRELEILEAVATMNKPDLTERVIDSMFPSEDDDGGRGKSRHWFADLVSVAVENKDALFSVLGSLLGGGVPATAPQQPGIDAFLRQQPPAAVPAASRFTRNNSTGSAGILPATPPQPEHQQLTPERNTELNEMADDIRDGSTTDPVYEISNPRENAEPPINGGYLGRNMQQHPTRPDAERFYGPAQSKGGSDADTEAAVDGEIVVDELPDEQPTTNDEQPPNAKPKRNKRSGN